jgi:glycosyltransferase involved in cell wall biosynthesis
VIGRGHFLCSLLHDVYDDLPIFPVGSNATAPRVLPHLIRRQSSFDKDVVVLVTHLTVSKLATFLFQIRWWGKAPISAGVYLQRKEDIDVFLRFLQEHADDLATTSFHLTLEQTTLPYPHNILRNLALDNAEGDFFVLADVDFIPSPEAGPKLSGLIRADPTIRDHLVQRGLLVLPALEAKNPNVTDTDEMLPRTKEQVMEMWHRKELWGFHMRSEHVQRPTRFFHWIENKTDTFYSIKYSNIYEPYVLAYRPGIPRFWEGFRGFGYNKFTWYYELDRADYKFGVLRDYWLVHRSHPEASDKGKRAMQDENLPEWRAFKDYLPLRYYPKNLLEFKSLGLPVPEEVTKEFRLRQGQGKKKKVAVEKAKKANRVAHRMAVTKAANGQ